MRRRHAHLVAFVLLAFPMVMVPASNLQWPGGRYRFVLELIFLPVAVAFVAAFSTRLTSFVRRFRAIAEVYPGRPGS